MVQPLNPCAMILVIDVAQPLLLKEKQISSYCNKAIIEGMDITTSKGIEHFSLQETD
jgi:hypothetical protein